MAAVRRALGRAGARAVQALAHNAGASDISCVFDGCSGVMERSGQQQVTYRDVFFQSQVMVPTMKCGACRCSAVLPAAFAGCWEATPTDTSLWYSEVRPADRHFLLRQGVALFGVCCVGCEKSRPAKLRNTRAHASDSSAHVSLSLSIVPSICRS